jgi:predicted dehydrogenase
MTDDTVHISVIGAGANTREKHIPLLQEIPGVEIHGVVNRSQTSSKRVAEQFGIPTIYEDWREAIEDEETDAVVIGTWPYLHAPIAIAALEAGKHVLCEARMAMNLQEARAMLEASRNNPDLIAQIVPAPMTFRVDATITRLLAQGYLGDILAVELRGGGGFLNRDTPLTWRHNADYSGLNTMQMGIYYETLLRWIGHARAVTAVGRTFVKMRKDNEGVLRSIRVPDHLDVIAVMECGAQASMRFSAVTGHAGPLEIFLYGTEGTLRVFDNQLFGGRKDDSALQPIELPQDEQAGWRVEREFIGAIRGEEEVRLTTFADGVKYMEFTEAVAISLQNEQTVRLPLA